MLKRVPSVLLLLLVSAPAVVQAQALKPDPVIEKLQRCSVTVQTHSASGSGFVMVRKEKVFVVTAAHVVNDLRHEVDAPEPGKPKKVEWDVCKVSQKKIQKGRIVGEQSYEAEVVRYAPKKDLALLQVKADAAFKEGLDLYSAEELPPIGTDLLHVGSPLGEIGSQSVIPGFYSGYGRIVEKQLLDQISCNAFPGSSGGAITLRDGRVVGVLVRGATGGFILIVPVREVREWANTASSSWLFDPGAAPDEKFAKGPIEDK